MSSHVFLLKAVLTATCHGTCFLADAPTYIPHPHLTSQHTRGRKWTKTPGSEQRNRSRLGFFRPSAEAQLRRLEEEKKHNKAGRRRKMSWTLHFHTFSLEFSGWEHDRKKRSSCLVKDFNLRAWVSWELVLGPLWRCYGALKLGGAAGSAGFGLDGGDGLIRHLRYLDYLELISKLF